MFSRLLLMGVLLLGLCGASRAANDACGDLVQTFNEKVDAGQLDDAQAAVVKLATDPLCSAFQVPAQRRLAAVRLRAATKLMARGRPPEEFEALLQEAAKPGILWQAAATLAEVHFGERRFDEAALGFDAAIEIVRNETLTPTPPETAEIQQLVDRAAQARLLEANLGSEHRAPTYVKTASNQRDGRLGGYLAPSVRGIVPRALPLPIVFDFDRATLTSVGEDAARDLLRAVQEQQPSKIVVIGHTDPRGGVEHNARLSQDRAETVAKFLHDNGLDVPVEAKGVGATEPMKIDDSEGLTVDDIYALNRRVEWQRQ